MEIIRHGTNFDFLGKSRTFLTISAILVTASLAAALIPGGLVFGVDFRGGSDIVLAFPKDVTDQGKITDALNAAGYEDPSVQNYGVENQDKDSFLVRLADISSLKQETVDAFSQAIKGKDPAGPDKEISIRFDPDNRDKIDVTFSTLANPQIVIDALKAAGLEDKRDYTLRGRAEEGTALEEGESARVFQVLPIGVANDVVEKLSQSIQLPEGTKIEVLNSTSVGPKAGEQLRNDGIKSIVFSMLLIMLFVALRFDFRYAPGAVVSIIHDVSLSVGVFALARIEFNLPAIAALLTITGYSLNDTIVVYDRIRENVARMKDKPLKEVINRSVNEMLGRTILVSTTVLLAITSLLVLGGGQIRSFALALFVGVIVGTYSSVYIAAPIVIWADNFIKARGLDKEEPPRHTTGAERPASPRKARE